MRIAVCVKHAVDEAELKAGSDGAPVLAGAACKMSTFDKNAVEEALRLKSAHSGEVVAVTAGPADARRTLKEALAMGADRGVIVGTDAPSADTSRTAGLLAAAVRKAGPFDLVICSEGSSDTYSGQVPPMLAEALGVPYVGYARKLQVDGSVARAERLLEDSVEEVEAPVPLVVSVVSEINEPRYPTLIQIMQASKKQVEEYSQDQLGVPTRPASVRVTHMAMQTSNRKRVTVEGSPEEAASRLVQALEREGVL